VAIARGTDKGELALGGADVILSTITNAGAMAAAFGGLRPHGTLLVVGADMDPIAVPAAAFIAGGTGERRHRPARPLGVRTAAARGLGPGAGRGLG
jgi:hypothetical protein